ncbi:MAG TPA: hypothetical protein VIR33_01870, partial [Thermopolyspora sp.]
MNTSPSLSTRASATHPPRPIDEIRAWSRELIAPRLRDAVARLDPWIAVMASYALGWRDDDRTEPASDREAATGGTTGVMDWAATGATAGMGGGLADRGAASASLRSALCLLCARVAGAPAHTAVAGATAVELVHAFSLIRE